ncbi:uncharacterized protein LOC117784818 [Drosophila innubila]|uniref:uncharacterized protein LOC117784818 n=1 Tax=Drosophila innubila TaxID=198719 RepID=UPI00148DCCC7|nr:uncharacterized protein LOC117784818 [Drosophila innubila]
MRWLLWCVLIGSFLGMVRLIEAKAKQIPMVKLGLHNNYNEIVRDLIKNWESPIVYLRQLGYLPNDYEDTSRIKPNLDALMSRMDRDEEKQALGPDRDKAKQLFCGASELRTKKKRDNVLGQRAQRSPTESQGLNYPSVDQLLAMKQPSLAVAMSAAKVDELLPKLKSADHHSPSNSQLILLSHLLAKQQPEQLHPQSETNQKSDDFLQRLVAKTSPQQTETQVAAGSQLIEDNAMKRTPEILPSNSVKSSISGSGSGDTNVLIARMRRNLKSRLRHRTI